MAKKTILGTMLVLSFLFMPLLESTIQEARASEATCDLNGDGMVDLKDIAIAARAFDCVVSDIRWNPLADVDGDGKVTIIDLAIIANHFGKVSVVSATIAFEPEELNLKSRGKWVTAHVKLPEGYDVSAIDISSMLLNDTVASELRPVAFGDDLMVKFDRQAVIDLILEHESTNRFSRVALTITGKLITGTQFRGSTTQNIITQIQ